VSAGGLTPRRHRIERLAASYRTAIANLGAHKVGAPQRMLTFELRAARPRGAPPRARLCRSHFVWFPRRVPRPDTKRAASWRRRSADAVSKRYAEGRERKGAVGSHPKSIWSPVFVGQAS
jgi:hypothetical protein